MNSRGISHNDRAFVYARDGHQCQNPDCKQRYIVNKILSIHHCFPKREGGANDSWNYVTLCTKCHLMMEKHLKQEKWRRLEQFFRQLALSRKPKTVPVWKDHITKISIKKLVKDTWRAVTLCLIEHLPRPSCVPPNANTVARTQQ